MLHFSFLFFFFRVSASAFSNRQLQYSPPRLNNTQGVLQYPYIRPYVQAELFKLNDNVLYRLALYLVFEQRMRHFRPLRRFVGIARNSDSEFAFPPPTHRARLYKIRPSACDSPVLFLLLQLEDELDTQRISSRFVDSR